MGTCGLVRNGANPALVTLLLGAVALGGPSCAERSLEQWSLPAQADWLSVGVVLKHGPPGTWDHLLAGGSVPGSVIKKEGVYYLYYSGADGKRRDGGPRHRAMGLATSLDGIRFTKHPASPVMTHLPNAGEEEGANSAAVALDEEGRFVMFYGAATQIDSENINADIRVATSTDGVAFRDIGRIVLDHREKWVHGYGDELFPKAAYRHEKRWFVLYVPNGGTAPRDIAVASGPTIDRLTRTEMVLDGTRADPAHVGGNVIPVDDDEVLVLAQRGWHPDIRISLHLAPASAPHRLGPPIASFEGGTWREETKFSTLMLDEELRTWFLYRSHFTGEISLHLAPAGPPDRTPPSPPGDLRWVLGAEGTGLSWSPSRDPDSGIAGYRVYREGKLVAFTIASTYRDAVPTDGAWAVSAVNLHGTEGPAVVIRSRSAGNPAGTP
jgi:hypothetical protein